MPRESMDKEGRLQLPTTVPMVDSIVSESTLSAKMCSIIVIDYVD